MGEGLQGDLAGLWALGGSQAIKEVNASDKFFYRFCPECGWRLTGKFSTCPWCGADLSVKVCPYCKGMIPAGASICPRCTAPN
jgi:RNA polymerase subunit RPABC4/transcription elongation factor Spt4